MGAQIKINNPMPEKLGIRGDACKQSINQQRTERSSKPIMNRDSESDLPPAEDCRRQLASHEFLKNQFLTRSANLERLRERGGEFHNSVVQKWRAYFDRMSHTHAVHLCQDIVWKIIFLIEPEIGF